MIIRELGRVGYQSTWDAMRAFTDARTPDSEDELWICEHDPVFTQGIAGRAEHLLINPANIPVVKTDRGGQITYHGPGQAMVYVLLNLKRAGYGVRELVIRVENAVIALLAQHGIKGYGKRDAPGVYVNFPLSRTAGEGRGEGGDEAHRPRISPPPRIPDDLKQFARDMRINATDAEVLMWSLVRDRRFLGLKFRRQHSIGRYIVDFYCDELKLALELDGGQHAKQGDYDAERSAWLAKQGVRTLRFWNNEFLSQTEAALSLLFDAVTSMRTPEPSPSPQPSPALRERETTREAKIAALGLKIRNGCTYHGLAFNVDMDLTPFSYINPCGYEGLRVTHLHELGVDVTLAEAGRALAGCLRDELSRAA